MARLKCTKIELVRLKKKLSLFLKYLPTLQLKKMLLQAEVNKAREELRKLEISYKKEKEEMNKHSHLLDDPHIHDLKEGLEIKEVYTTSENIAGIQVPVLEKLSFKDPLVSLIKTPVWVDTTLRLIRKLKHTYQMMLVGLEKKQILENELRVVSIRVNLFEKRMIPELESQINQIRIFLGDQELQAVASAKVSKEKILKRKERKEGFDI
jgi:V/A-type H+-transporting ATPase subunit D